MSVEGCGVCSAVGCGGLWGVGGCGVWSAVECCGVGVLLGGECCEGWIVLEHYGMWVVVGVD